MLNIYILIAAGVVFALILFRSGYHVGFKLRQKRFSPDEFRMLGGDYDIKMRDLINENKVHINLWEKMSGILSQLAGFRDREKLAPISARIIREELEANYSAVILKEENVFKAVAIEGLHADSLSLLEFSVDEPLIAYISEFPGVVTLDTRDRQFHLFKRVEEKIGQIMMMPLKMGHEVHGILWVARKKGGRAFSVGEKSILEYTGNAIGYLVRNIDLIHDLESRAVKLVTGLMHALEQRDDFSKGHSERVSSYSVMFARHIGLDSSLVENIRRAALLHDIGKIGIPDKILNKPDSFSPEEYTIVKSHPLYGAELLKILGFMKEEQILILHHHEKYDGTGYPYGISSMQIPKGSVIISLSDVFDALTTEQPYRKAYSIDEAIEIMKGMEGEYYDPEILNAFTDFVKSRQIRQEN